jgi:Lon protease-like protein
MPESLEELPLFPLRTVLFPHATLRLHVFEERYRIMVHECLRTDSPFGIALIRQGEETGAAEPYLVGTVARITKVETYEDGRMDIEVIGERRFRIRRIDEESHPYLLGHVETVEEHGAPDPLDDTVLEARETFVALVKRYFERQRFEVQVVFPSDPQMLSFTIANLLPVDDLVKQRLLEISDSLDRLDEMLPYLRAALQEAQPIDTKGHSFVPLATNDLSEWANPN